MSIERQTMDMFREADEPDSPGPRVTALRLPVEATRVERIDGRPPVWFVGDEAGRTEVDLGGNLRAAFVRLARSQELWPVWGATAPGPDWRARIAEEKARWETALYRAFREADGVEGA